MMMPAEGLRAIAGEADEMRRLKMVVKVAAIGRLKCSDDLINRNNNTKTNVVE